jgi:hypothetical protein
VARVQRLTPDLSAYPDLVVVYLGMRVRRLVGVKTLLGFGPQIQRSWQAQPDGLLRHEDILWSLRPPHVGMRQYWRDLDSLEAWTRSAPHREWWTDYMHDSGGTGFWHEAYFMRGGIDAIYDDLGAPVGLSTFAPTSVARGRMFSSRERAGQGGESPAPVLSETELYGADPAASDR